MKFKVGDRVNFTYNGDTYEGVIRVIEDRPRSNFPYHVEIIPYNTYCWVAEYDIQNLIQPAVTKESETKEPIPGKFYRTGDGRKLLYIGKQIKGYYLYQSLDGGLHTYTGANLSGDKNIVGEWVSAENCRYLAKGKCYCCI